MKHSYKIIIYCVGCAVLAATIYSSIFIFSARSKVHDKYSGVLVSAQNIFSREKVVDGGIYREVGSMEWKNKDGWNITAAHEPYIESYYLCKASSDNFKDVMPVVFSELDKVFASYGFSKNAQNTVLGSQSGYEKGDTECLVRADPSCLGLPGGHGEKYGSSIGVICTDQLAKRELEQLPLLKGLNLKNSAISNIHDYGEFVDLHIDYSEVIAKKEKDGKYTMLYKGQDAPPCEIEGEYDFPSELKSRLTTSSGAACPSK